MKEMYLKYISYVLGTILLGAIGSGLWERFLGPVTDSCVDLILKFFSFFSEYYSNSLYREIGNANKEGFSFSIYLYSQLFLILPLIFVFTIINRRAKEAEKLLNKENLESNENRVNIALEVKLDKVKSKLKNSKVFNSVFIFFLILIVVSQVAREVYQYRTILYIERTIEILGPYTDQLKLLQLKSEYRQIDTKEKFIQLENKFISIAKGNKLKLPEFNYIE